MTLIYGQAFTDLFFWVCERLFLFYLLKGVPMIAQLATPVLTIVVGWLVRQALRALKVEIDEATYNALVAAIVVYLLALVGVEAGVRAGLLG